MPNREKGVEPWQKTTKKYFLAQQRPMWSLLVKGDKTINGARFTSNIFTGMLAGNGISMDGWGTNSVARGQKARAIESEQRQSAAVE